MYQPQKAFRYAELPEKNSGQAVLASVAQALEQVQGGLVKIYFLDLVLW